MRATVATIFVFLAIATATFVPKKQEQLGEFRTECFKTLNVPKELQDKYIKFEYPDDELTHKHVRCIAEKFETWNEKDGYISDYLIQQFGEAKKPTIEKCLTKHNPEWSAEKWAWNDWKCLADNGIMTK